MTISEIRGRVTAAASSAPLNAMPSADRAARRRRDRAGLLLMALGVSALSVGATRAVLAPRLQALQAGTATARAEARDARSDLAVLQVELDRMRTVEEFSARFDIPADLAAAIHEAALRENLNPDIAFRLVSTESAFRRYAVSPVGAVGYAQLMPATAAWLEPGITTRDLFDRDTNLRLGFRYLRMLLDQYGDLRLALLAYNRGPGVVNRVLARGGDPANGYARLILGTE